MDAKFILISVLILKLFTAVKFAYSVSRLNQSIINTFTFISLTLILIHCSLPTPRTDPSIPSPLSPSSHLPAVITPLDALLLGVLAACGVSLVGVPMLALLGLINPFNSAGKPFRVMPPTAITTVQANSPLTPSASSIVQTTAEIKDGDDASSRKIEKRHAAHALNSWKRIAEHLERLVRAQNALRNLKNVG